MNIFEYEQYRKFTRNKLATYPRKGHGQAKKLADHLRVSTAFISQVLGENRHLTSDQAYLACEFLTLSEAETTYYLKLLEFEKAGHHRHKKWLRKELDELKEKSKKISNRLQANLVLKDEEKAIFYSDWYYSALRLYCSIEPRDVETLVQLIGLPRKLIVEALQFLLKAGLVIEEKEKYKIGPLSTHVDADSPWVLLHHSNWRKKALDQIKIPSDVKTHYTSPMTLSQNDAERIQALLLKAIEDVGQIVDPSPSEELYCLNLDWFRVYSKI